MDTSSLYLIVLNIILLTIAGLLLLYPLFIRYHRHSIQEAAASKRKSAEKELSSHSDLPVMKYAEYKKEFGSRSREIAIIAHAKLPETLETVAEFTEKMREDGTFIYHFTNYWGNADQKETHRMLTEVVQDNYDGIFTIGTGLTKLARNICLTNSKFPPIVFARTSHEIWEREQKKKLAPNITGITTKDGSEYRIKMFLNIKPFMRSALIPITHQTFYDSAQTMATILTSYGVTTHAIRVHGDNDLLSTLSQYCDKVDSIILTRAAISAELCTAIAQKCSEHAITFFSPSLKDSAHGAAVTMCSVNENFGNHAAQKMLSIIEDGIAPAQLPLYTIDQGHQYEIHFNQIAMQSQGLDSSRITTIALQHSSRVYTVFDKDNAS